MCVPAFCCRSNQDVLYGTDRYIIWRKVQSSCIIDRLQPWQLVPTTSRLNIRSIGLNELLLLLPFLFLLLLLLLPFLLLLYCSWKAKSPVLCRSITSLPAPLVADISRGGLALVSIVSSIELKALANPNPSPPMLLTGLLRSLFRNWARVVQSLEETGAATFATFPSRHQST